MLGTFAGERACSRDVRGAFLVTSLLMAAAVFLAATMGTHAYLAPLSVTLWGLAFGVVPMCVQIWLYKQRQHALNQGQP
ncbi:hypothetical protein AEQ67_19025 [Pseudomonas sp. RIT-PI-q]|nr:hypothetical protein AEQ67_19025 [Pseudomonas sp. RIT-PI-q]